MFAVAGTQIDDDGKESVWHKKELPITTVHRLRASATTFVPRNAVVPSTKSLQQSTCLQSTCMNYTKKKSAIFCPLIAYACGYGSKRNYDQTKYKVISHTDFSLWVKTVRNVICAMGMRYSERELFDYDRSDHVKTHIQNKIMNYNDAWAEHIEIFQKIQCFACS